MKKTFVEINVTGITELSAEEFTEKFNSFLIDQGMLHLVALDGEEELIEVLEIEILATEPVDEEE